MSGNIRITEYGFIKGGACERRLTNRFDRVSGCRISWNEIKKDSKYIARVRGGYKIIKKPKPLARNRWGKFSSGEQEVGFLRMSQSVLPGLFNEGQIFKLKEMKTWIEAMGSAEFHIAMENPLQISWMGLVPPKPSDDVIYSKMHGVPTGLVEYQQEKQKKKQQSK